MIQPIITSLLDVDFYKFLAAQLAFHQFRNLKTKYEFTCRNKATVELLKYVPEDELRAQLKALDKIRITGEEINFLRSTEKFEEDFLEFLRHFKFNVGDFLGTDMRLFKDKVNDTYAIEVENDWPQVILYETMVLSIVNEIYEKNYTEANSSEEAVEDIVTDKLAEKIHALHLYNQECEERGVEIPQIIEFGTRRRYSQYIQSCVLDSLVTHVPENLVGTSNVLLAMEFDLNPIGTFGHEVVMAMQGVYAAKNSQVKAFQHWLKEYKGELAIALTDTLGDDKFFFDDWTPELANAYKGVRHDSGDPFLYAERVIQSYKSMGIDPTTKTIIFSDGLDIPTVIALHREFVGRINIMFGIGTNLTNDCGNPVLHIVMKMTYSDGTPVVKLSANPDKSSCKLSSVLEYVKDAANNFYR